MVAYIQQQSSNTQRHTPCDVTHADTFIHTHQNFSKEQWSATILYKHVWFFIFILSQIIVFKSDNLGGVYRTLSLHPLTKAICDKNERIEFSPFVHVLNMDNKLSKRDWGLWKEMWIIFYKFLTKFHPMLDICVLQMFKVSRHNIQWQQLFLKSTRKKISLLHKIDHVGHKNQEKHKYWTKAEGKKKTSTYN